jgi:hypothetical protein
MAMAIQAKVLSGNKLEQLVMRLQRLTGRPKEACWRLVIQHGIKGRKDHRRWTESEEEQFTEIHKNVLSEIGLLYRDKLAGYWFDSWYQSLAAYPDVPIDAIFRYCKVGIHGRITAFNFWIFPVLTPWQDYWAGELNALQNPFESRYIQRSAGAGFQAHGMVSMLRSWVHSETGPIPTPQFSAEDLIAYVKANIEHQAVTTINIGIYPDGTIEQSSLDMMRQLRRATREK